MNSSDWDHAYKRRYLRHPCIVEPADSIDWVERVVYGNIVPQDLE